MEEVLKNKYPNCPHENIGRRALGGFPGHEHYHPTGNQLCLDCGVYLETIISDRFLAQRTQIIGELQGMKVEILWGKGSLAEEIVNSTLAQAIEGIKNL